MAQQEDRSSERKVVLSETARHMVENTTNIEGVSFFKRPEEHIVFMAALLDHGQKQLEEVKKIEVAV